MTTLAPRQSSSGLVRRGAGWIQGWHGAQLATFWAACVIVPWRIGVWRHLLFSNRFEPFINPGSTPTGWARLAGLLAYAVLPLLALVITGVWAAARIGRRESSRP